MKFSFEEIESCFNFAYNMRGNHNPDLIQIRKDWEIFRDDFRGKLGEIAVYKYIKEQIPNANITTELDFNVTPRGQWDITDLEVNELAINIKSIKQKSKFLLVECNRYDANGNYRYRNNDGGVVRVDYYILVRVTVEPDVSISIFRTRNADDFVNKAWDAKNKKEISRTINAEVLGGISHEDFWKNKSFAPRKIKCSVNNLRAICNGVSIGNLPDKTDGTESQNQILQQDNYIINSENQLEDLNEIFN